MNFSDLDLAPALLNTLKASGYSAPTPIQAAAIPPALAGRDILLSAQTGSGKTAAFVLPLLQHMIAHKTPAKTIRALILTPTRELAQQVEDSVRRYGRDLTWLRSVALIGGAPYGGQIHALKKGAQIIVATPGRLLDHLQSGRLDFKQLEHLVLDEADRMLDMGFADDLNAIVDTLPKTRQTIMSSATWAGRIGSVASRYTHDAVRIDIAAESAHIDESVYYCDDRKHKDKILDRLLDSAEMTQTIVFTATKRSSEELAASLGSKGHRACFLHGDLPQRKRSRVVAELRNGNCDILIATDVAARGLDIPAISHVINYDLPRQVEDYVHRIGRSGRAGRSGTAINLCSLPDRAQLSAINRYLERPMDEKQLNGLEPQKTAAAVAGKRAKNAPRNKKYRARTASRRTGR